MRASQVVAGALLLGGLLFLARNARASYAPTLEPSPAPGDVPPTEDATAADPVAAFLFAIAACEVGESAALDGRAYSTFYGGAQFHDLSQHPALTGEMRGVPLSDAMCSAAGFGPGCVSTAAGAYQINLPTWREFGADLPDFSPESQDEAARRILARTGALDALLNGDFESAVALASSRWASLPGSSAGQRPKSLAAVASAFQTGLAIQA